MARAKRRGRIVRWLRAILITALAVVGAVLLLTVGYRWIDPPTTTFMLRDRIGALVSREKGYEFRHDWRDWNRISPNAALAVIAAEDQRFPLHSGFDFEQIDKALRDRERGRRVRGASTITQQVAKNLFLWPGQSWVRKGLEAGLTVVIESTWPKRRILEVYLNVAEFGRGTWGVQAASRRFFRKDAAKLSRSEAALLAAVLPAPRRFKVDAPSAYVHKRQAWIQRQMAGLGGTSYVADLD